MSKEKIIHSLKTELHSLFRPEGVTNCNKKVSKFRFNEFYSRDENKVTCESCLKKYNKAITDKWGVL